METESNWRYLKIIIYLIVLIQSRMMERQNIQTDLWCNEHISSIKDYDYRDVFLGNKNMKSILFNIV